MKVRIIADVEVDTAILSKLAVDDVVRPPQLRVCMWMSRVIDQHAALTPKHVSVNAVNFRKKKVRLPR